MSQQHYSLTWDAYKSNICKGFISLQKNAEFVDMTLAADGHIVKVHQMLMALASPYLKEMITSVASPHPVIFLNNVTYSTLCGILQYIYTGEVFVPQAEIETFIAAAKALRIKGLDNLYHLTPNEPSTIASAEQTEESAKTQPEQNSFLRQLPANARRTMILHDTGIGDIKSGSGNTCRDEEHIYRSDCNQDDFERDIVANKISNSAKKQKIDSQNASTQPTLQFTVSTRGAVQVILNRYLYGISSTSKTRRTWKCVDNKSKKCRAFIVTEGNIVLKRANPHNHPFHDKKILYKIKRNTVFSAIEEAHANININEITITTDIEMDKQQDIHVADESNPLDS